jgi:hypothetical protein
MPDRARWSFLMTGKYLHATPWTPTGRRDALLAPVRGGGLAGIGEALTVAFGSGKRSGRPGWWAIERLALPPD